MAVFVVELMTDVVNFDRIAAVILGLDPRIYCISHELIGMKKL